MNIGRVFALFVSVLLMSPNLSHSAVYMGGGIWVGQNTAQANTTVTADEELGETVELEAYAKLTEDGSTVAQQTKNCDVDSDFVTCRAKAAKTPPTENCNYCGSGHGKAWNNITQTFGEEWGISPTECGSSGGGP